MIIDLRAVVEAWDRLPEAIRTRIIGLVEEATVKAAAGRVVS